jgi:ABC-type antimicrobial peptide transport system permease subunit
MSEILDSIRRAVTRADSGLTPVRVKTLETQTRESLSRERLLAILSSYIGGFALLLACIGLYGLMNYAVTQRTAEIGMRLALGATPAAIRGLITREGIATALVGLVIGLVVSSLFVGIVRTQLFDVQPLDPSTFISAGLLLLAVAWVAAYLPGIRASRTEPLNALRHE